MIAGYGKLTGKSKFKTLDNIIKKIHKIYSNIINFSYIYIFISFLILLKERKNQNYLITFVLGLSILYFNLFISAVAYSEFVRLSLVVMPLLFIFFTLNIINLFKFKDYEKKY